MYIAIFALFLGTFSIGTTEFVIAGILPLIATDLAVTIPTAGLLVTWYALGVAIGGPILTLSLVSMPRKAMALAMMGLFILGHVICGLADSYFWAMVGRVVSAMGHGAFFGLAVVLTARVAHPDKVGKALSFIFAGVAIANIVGVPLGTWVGSMWGWRATIWMVGGFACIAWLGVFFFVPKAAGGSEKAGSIGAQFAALGNQQVLTSFALIFLSMISLWGLNTFIAPFLTQVVGAPEGWISGILLLFGVLATFGVLLGGRLADSNPLGAITWSFPALVLTYALVILFAGGNLYLGILLVTITIVPITVLATPLQNRVLIGAKGAPELASTLISSVYNTGTALGSWIAATALTGGLAYVQLPYLSLGAAVLAAILAFVVTTRDRRRITAAA